MTTWDALCRRLEGEVAALRSRAAQGEAAAKSKDREVERLTRAVEASKVYYRVFQIAPLLQNTPP
jgi:hypothetical protein